MPKRNKPRRPSPAVLGPLRARVINGPRESDRRWYWRLEMNRESAGCRWAHESEIPGVLIEHLTGDPTAKPRLPDNVSARPKTLGALITMWLNIQEQRNDLESRSFQSFETCAKRLIKAAGSWKLDAVAFQLHELRDRPLAVVTRRQDFKTLNRIWRWGAERNLCSGVLPRVRLAGPPPVRYTPSSQEATKVEQRLTTHYKVAHAILRITGCRSVAVERLTWDAVDLDGRVLHLIGKGRRPRSIPIPDELVEVLRDWKPRTRGPRVIPIRYIANHLRTRIKDACIHLKIKPYALHGLRRLRVREYRRAGVPVRIAADLLGHSPGVMLRMYDETSLDDRRQAIDLAWREPDKAPGS